MFWPLGMLVIAGAALWASLHQRLEGEHAASWASLGIALFALVAAWLIASAEVGGGGTGT
jgi:hypothetical protein